MNIKTCKVEKENKIKTCNKKKHKHNHEHESLTKTVKVGPADCFDFLQVYYLFMFLP